MANRSALIVVGIILVIGIIVGTIALLPDQQERPAPVPAEVPQEVVEYYEREAPPVQPQEAAPTEVGPRGKIAFVASGGNIHIINADGSGEKRLVAGRWPIWSPDEERIAFWDENRTWSIIDVDNLEKIELLTAGFLGWLPDAQRLIFIYGSGVSLINRDGTGLVQVAPFPKRVRAPRLSPDGSKVAYFVWLGNDCAISDWALGVTNLDGSGQVILSQDYCKPLRREIERSIAWSPDGKKIAYSTAVDLLVINSDGTNRILIDERGLDPTWTPDGRILFTRAGHPPHDLYIVNPDGTGKRVLIPDTEQFVTASWSPCGGWLALERRERSIYISKADGTVLRKLAFGEDPQWSPRTP